jgi:nanoRNase/pAp phosphatase (c-di-AMP/oligoRNAs hydrolase)
MSTPELNSKNFKLLTEKILNTTQTQVFILTTHLGADFDDFSSLVALLDYLNHLKNSKHLKIETHICLSGELDQNYLDLTPESDFFWRDENFADFSDYFKDLSSNDSKIIYLSVFGCSDLKRALGNPYTNFIYNLNQGNPLFETLSFDHHIQGETWAKYNFVDDKASSNAENLLDILLTIPEYKLSAKTATNLMIGLVSDTVNFFASSTTNLTHKHAGELMSLGCDIAKVREIIHEKWTVENLNRLNILIQRAEFLDITSLTWSLKGSNTSFAVLDCSMDSDISSLFSNEILDILKTQMVVMIKTGAHPKDRKLSIRCLPESKVNAVDLATHFGGGGHRLAAGGSIDGHDVEWFKGELVQFLKKAQI